MASKQPAPAGVVPEKATGQIKNFDSLRNILRSSRSDMGTDLYQHLVEVVNHIVMHCPESGLDKFEEISYLLKHKDHLNINKFLKVTESYLYNA